MQVKRDGVVFRTAYAFTKDRYRPMHDINGCELLWRFVSRAPVRAIIIIWYLAIQPLIIGIIMIAAVVAFFFGNRLDWVNICDKNKPLHSWAPYWLRPIEDLACLDNWGLRPIKKWPILFGVRYWPCVFGPILLIGLDALAISGAYHAWETASSPSNFFRTVWPMVFLVNGIMALACIIVVLLLIYDMSEDTEVMRLMKAGLQSFKDKTCPVVEVVD